MAARSIRRVRAERLAVATPESGSQALTPAGTTSFLGGRHE